MMFLSALVLLSEFLVFIPVTVKADCPATFPYEIQGKCYALQTDGLKFQDASDMCMRLGGRMTTIRSDEVLEKMESIISNFIAKQMEDAKFWIGLVMPDRSLSKPKEDREWEWVYDESRFIQKEYKLWDEEGGTKEAGLTCAAVDCANDFLVKALDCGGARLPIVCLMNKDKTCKHDMLPYLTYGEHCLAVLKYADAYSKVAPGCHPETPTPYLEEFKPSVIMAIKNSFVGGGLLMNMKKMGNKFIDLETMKEPDEDQWEEGEPRDQYECVGYSFQPDNTLKLKTISCQFVAAYLCVYGQ